MTEKKSIKLFGLYEAPEVIDPGLKAYINLGAMLVPKTSGRNTKKQFHKGKMHVVERLINRLMVPGHRGKKHRHYSGMCVGKYDTCYKIVKESFAEIQKKTGKNPLEMYIRAIENAALVEEVKGYQVGGMIVRKAVITSPLRRLDLAIRHIVQGAFAKKRNKKNTMIKALADEIIRTAEKSTDSFAIKERERLEREASGAR